MPSPLAAGAAALALAALAAPPASAQAPPADRAARRADLQRQKAAIEAELAALDASAAPTPSARRTPAAADAPAQVVVVARSAPVAEAPLGQTVVSVSRDLYKDTPAFSVGDILKLAPGVSFTQGNGPRDVSVSVRGSNARQSFGLRNSQVFEDGFPVTQPDGTARTDLTDPHAYADVEVVEGPSSALYGNYATAGAILFHTRHGGDIDGVEAGADFGSYGYFNDYATLGAKGDRYEYSAFASNVRGDGFAGHTGYTTTTENMLATYALTPRDRVTVKFINNDLDTDLSLRLSRLQYGANPYQLGCATAATPGCATLSLFTNGFNGARQAVTAAQVDSGRHDRRTIVGARYEHDLDDATTWRTTATFDNRDIRQPTAATDFRGDYPSFNLISDLTRRGTLFGRASTTLGGVFFNYQNINSTVFNVLPRAGSQDGGLTQTVYGHQLNAGARGREELALTPTLTAVAGLGVEHTGLQANEVNVTYAAAAAAPTQTPIAADRGFFNVAPEASLVWRPQPELALHARVSTGYGAPQATNLFVTPQGAFGNNTQLKSQSNTGIDLGAAFAGADLKLTATLFYEFFDNEFVTQSAGVGSQSYTFNAPHSEHRGAELGLDWRPLPSALPGARLYVSYLYDDQRYTSYVEQLTSGMVTASFDRAGRRIPGVTPNFGVVRVIYDQPAGLLRGLGGFVEGVGSDAFAVDNANLLSTPGYVLLNADLHYDPPAEFGLVSRLRFYVDVQNLLDQRTIASSTNITDSLNPATGAQNGAGALAAVTGSIYAGAPRSVFGGVRVKF